MSTTTERVPEHTAASVNEQIHRRTEQNVREYGTRGREVLSRRLAELEREWDIERALEANAASLVLFGAGLALLVNRRFSFIPLVVGGFLLQHAVQGWCPPLPILRRLGLRTQTEIGHERYALKALRGDFREVQAADGGLAPSRALSAAEV